jgi:clan AA aspartic protease (TIGR02281 family)
MNYLQAALGGAILAGVTCTLSAYPAHAELRQAKPVDEWTVAIEIGADFMLTADYSPCPSCRTPVTISVTGKAKIMTGVAVENMSVHLAVPPRPVERKATVALGAYGNNFYTPVVINGVGELGIIDTGASDVALTAETASQIGIVPKDGDYTQESWTANGIAYSAPITLDHLRLGSIDLDHVEASVAKPGALQGNLIGMSALRRLHVEFGHGTMTLTQI